MKPSTMKKIADIVGTVAGIVWLAYMVFIVWCLLFLPWKMPNLP
jgi:hypothetical protein